MLLVEMNPIVLVGMNIELPLQQEMSPLVHCYKYGHVFLCGKTPFLTIQLLLKYGFDHRTSKPVIFSHQTIKTVQM
jgi:hypothetical protein